MLGKYFKFRKLQGGEKRRLRLTLFLYLGISVLFLSAACGTLLKDNLDQPRRWNASLQENSGMLKELEEIRQSKNPTRVLCGTYLEDIRNIDFKNNSFSGVMTVWFRWENDKDLDIVNHFRIYRGDITDLKLMDDYHENGINYQKARVSFTITRNYKTPRFPLGSYQLHIYIEPERRCDQVQLTADTENSTMNANLQVSGYNVTKRAVVMVPIRYQNTQSDPELLAMNDSDVRLMTTELLTAVEITRAGIGTYLKCFIALFATLIWVLISLYLSTVHEVDPLGMIPGAFFGAVSNIMVGASLLPDALQPGLIEFVNIWGVGNILGIAMMIISINSIRQRYHRNDFAKYYGRIMLVTATLVTTIGNILLPLVCVI